MEEAQGQPGPMASAEALKRQLEVAADTVRMAVLRTLTLLQINSLRALAEKLLT